MPRRSARATAAVVGLLLAVGCGPQPQQRATVERPTVRTAATASVPQVGARVWANVSVATLWVDRSSPRPVDAPALANPVHIRAWLQAMSIDDRRGLVGRVETQVLYGEPMKVTAVHRRWLHVVALWQPTHRDTRGYPGWVPARQVTTVHPVRARRIATVTQRLATLTSPDPSRTLRVSFGTRLPVLAVHPRSTVVASPTGARLRVRNSAIVRRPRSAPALRLGRRAVMASARLFVGTPYLWGGRSGYAVDCSGFTNLVYAVHGVRLPRDADDQAQAGQAVAIGDQRRSDLMFFQRGSTIGHVGFYAGHGRLLHAPGTGMTVQVAPLSSVSGLVAVRRFT